MIKIILTFLCLIGLANANIPKTSFYEANKEVLKSFDVDTKFIQDFHTNKKSANKYKTWYFLKVLKQGRDFIPMIRDIIAKEQIPEIFLYLAMAESNFSPHATSSQKAAGLWQFMPSTAKKYGLKIDEYIDERRDPVKSTKSAIKYIKYLYSQLGKWYLAAMAYNCGESRVKRAIKEAKSDNIAILLDEKKKYIPKETRRYIKKILYLATLNSKHKNDILQYEEIKSFDTVRVPAFTSLYSIAQSIGVSTKKIKELNPQLKHYFTPPKKGSYSIYIPYGKKLRFTKKFKPSSKYNGFEVHVVKSGESLWTIGKRYGVKYSLIKNLNNLKSKKIKPNQKLVIPVTREVPVIYVVQNGDTLGKISKKFKIKMSDIRKENNIKKYIKPGDKLVIPTQK